MSKGNKATRDKAVPFIAEPFLANGALVFTAYDSLDSLSVPTLATNLTKVIPLCRPQKGDVVEAHLFMRMIAPSNRGLSVKIGIGTMTSETPQLTYSSTDIDLKHRALTGSADPLTCSANGTLVVEANLTKLIPKRGDSDFYQEAFCLLVTFDVLPDVNLGYDLDKFFVAGSAQMGVNR